ncbi:hypothetical protein BVC71_14450 [Marivivens niveibacter]|uniref:HTH luxR-type domain-containing protein n=2 Tax=Marivivens niveibacter TaxID=1930667 RepID=A0A251WUP5_9RHOB|nr:hypothetical protein BVC71_14450 [Marivivens niveibacter]
MGRSLFENARFARLIFWGMVVSALFFSWDVIVDFRAHLVEQRAYSGSDLGHLIFELVAVIVLVFGMVLLSFYISDLRGRNAQQAEVLHSLRHDFDKHVQLQFRNWALTPSELDIALLLMRGVATKDIAELRNSSVGTVKVHSHNVFRKAGVSSRVELMAYFLDEFMDVGMQRGSEDDNARDAARG